MAWGVVGAARRAGRGRVAGPPRGVRAVPGVRIVALRGVPPALAARRKGVTGLGAMLARRWSWGVLKQHDVQLDGVAYIIVQRRRMVRSIGRDPGAHALLLPCRVRHGDGGGGERCGPSPRPSKSNVVVANASRRH